METDEFWKKMDCVFLVQNRAAFCLLRFSQKQCGMLTRHYHSKTARYGLRNDRRFSITINTDYTSSPTFPSFVSTLCCNRAAFCLLCFLAKAMRHADDTLSFQNSAIRATQRSKIFNDYKHRLYKLSDFSEFCFYPVLQKATRLNFCFNKMKFFCAIVILMWRNR